MKIHLTAEEILNAVVNCPQLRRIAEEAGCDIVGVELNGKKIHAVATLQKKPEIEPGRTPCDPEFARNMFAEMRANLDKQ